MISLSKKLLIILTLSFSIGQFSSGQSATDDVAASQSGKAEHAAAAGVSDWPNWMGPDHDGIVKGLQLKEPWPEQGLRQAWTREIGIGFSGISIAGGKLYTMGHVKGKEIVYCMDSATGEEVWRYEYPCKLVNNLYEGGPGSTPTIHAGRVFTLGKEGQLNCFGADDGVVKWSANLQRDLDVKLPEWGFNSSAFVLGDAIILEAGCVVAYEMSSGKKLWQSNKHSAGYGSVALYSDEGRKLLASLDCGALRVVDASNGEILDSFPWTSPFRTNSTTPIIHNKKIYISTGYQIGCGLFTFDGSQLKLIYDNREMRNHFNNSILHNGYLYGMDGNSHVARRVKLVCMNFETGEVAWSQGGFGCGSLIVVGDRILILSDSGDLVLAKASPKGYEELARSSFLEGRCWTVPTVIAGKIYGRNARGRLVCAEY